MTSIYIDMDDVLSESNQTFLHRLEKELGKKMEYSQSTTFDLQESFDLSDDEYGYKGWIAGQVLESAMSFNGNVQRCADWKEIKKEL